MENLLTVPEVASILRISESGLRALVRQGKIPGKRLGPRTLRFDSEAIALWRKQFFDIPDGDQESVTKETRMQELGFSNDGERQDMGAINRRVGQTQGSGKGRRASGFSPVTQKFIEQMRNIESRDDKGGRAHRPGC